jgi:hypothetical protein
MITILNLMTISFFKKNQFNFEVDEGSFINWQNFIASLNFEGDLTTSGD